MKFWPYNERFKYLTLIMFFIVKFFNSFFFITKHSRETQMELELANLFYYVSCRNNFACLKLKSEIVKVR